MDQNTSQAQAAQSNSAQGSSSQATQTQYKLVIDDEVVEKITAYATQKIDGIIEMKGNILSTIQENFGGTDKTKGVDADVDDNRATVNLSIILEYGKSASEVFERIKKVVVKDVREMTDLEIEELTVHVVDVMTMSEYKKQNDNKKDDSN